MRYVIAPQSDHCHSKTITELGFNHRFSDELRARRQNDFRHPDLLRSVGEINSTQRHFLERVLLAQRFDVASRFEKVNQQYVACLQLHFCGGPKYLARQSAVTFESDNTCTDDCRRSRFSSVLPTSGD